MSDRHAVCGFHGLPQPCRLCAEQKEQADRLADQFSGKVLICVCPTAAVGADVCVVCNRRTREAAFRELDAFLDNLPVPAGDRPLPAEPGSTTEECVDLLRQRHHHGKVKYGVTLDRTDLTADEWCQHHLEELADAIGYTMRQRKEMKSLRETVRHGEGVNSALRDVVRKQQAELATLREQLAAEKQANVALTAALEEQP